MPVVLAILAVLLSIGGGAFLGAYAQPACQCPDQEKVQVQLDYFNLRIREVEAGNQAIEARCVRFTSSSARTIEQLAP